MKTFKISEKIGKLLKSAKQELSSFSIMIWVLKLAKLEHTAITYEVMMIIPSLNSLIVDIVNHVVKYNQVPASSIELYECIPLRFLPMLDKFIIISST